MAKSSTKKALARPAANHRAAPPAEKSRPSRPGSKATAAAASASVARKAPGVKSTAKTSPAAPAVPVSPQRAATKAAVVAKAERPPKSKDKGHRNGEAVMQIQPRAIPTDEKPRKNQAGISPRELEPFRDLLLAKRRELVGDMSSMETEALRTSGGSNLSNLPIHMADMGTDNYEQEFTLGLMEKDRVLLRDINAALGKIQDGTYGICEGTGKPISRSRLLAQPWARYSIEHARKLELYRMGR